MDSLPRSALRGTLRKRADIYIRLSNKELAQGYSPEAMLKLCRVKAQQLGADVLEEVVEADAKRWELDAPGLLRALDRARAGQIDYLISFSTDRLSGDLMKTLWLRAEFSRFKAEVRYATQEFEQDIYGRTTEDIQAIMHRMERWQTAARTQRAIKEKLARGLPVLSGPTLYGYTKVRDERGKPINLAPHNDTARVFRRIVRELPEKANLAICRELNAEGVPTPSGKGTWKPGTIQSLLDNTTYIGEYRFGACGQELGRAPDGKRTYKKIAHPEEAVATVAVPALVTRAELAAARAAMTARRCSRNGRRPEADDPYALRGRARCGGCGSVLQSVAANGYRRYSCGNAYGPKVARGAGERCPLPQVAADALEAHVWGELGRLLSDRAMIERALDDLMDGGAAMARYRQQHAVLAGEIDRLKGRIRRANEDLLTVEHDSFSAQDLREGRARDELALKQLTPALHEHEAREPVVMSRAGAEAIRATVASVLGGLQGATPAEQRAVYRLLGAEVTVRASRDGCVKVGADTGGEVKLGRRWWSVGLALRVGVLNGGKDSHGSFLLLSTSPTLRARLEGRGAAV